MFEVVKRRKPTCPGVCIMHHHAALHHDADPRNGLWVQTTPIPYNLTAFHLLLLGCESLKHCMHCIDETCSADLQFKKYVSTTFGDLPSCTFYGVRNWDLAGIHRLRDPRWHMHAWRLVEREANQTLFKMDWRFWYPWVKANLEIKGFLHGAPLLKKELGKRLPNQISFYSHSDRQTYFRKLQIASSLILTWSPLRFAAAVL